MLAVVLFAAGFVVGLLVQGGRDVTTLARAVPALVRLDVVIRRLVQYAAERPGAGRVIGEALGALAAVWAIVQGPGDRKPGAGGIVAPEGQQGQGEASPAERSDAPKGAGEPGES